MRQLLLLASATVWLSCASDASSVSVGNTNPVGTIGGLVIDAATEMPIMGATVQLIAGGTVYDATTDANGIFSATSVPSGGFIATIASTGYQSAMLNGALGGAVGNFPVKDPIATIGPVGLIKNDGVFAVKMVDQFGAAAANVAVVARPQIRWVNFSNGAPFPMGSYEVQATSGADGMVMLTGLPNYASLGSLGGGSIDTLLIDVPPMQVMGSMTVYSFLGGTFSFNVAHLENSNTTVIDQAIIRLAGPLTSLQILNSNVDLLRGLTAGVTGTPVGPVYTQVSTIPYINPTGPITIEFNQVINRGTVKAKLYDEDGGVSTIMMMATGANNVLTITPGSALTAGTRYNLSLHVDAAVIAGQSGIARELNTTLPLFVAPAAGAMLHMLSTEIKSLQLGPSPQPFVVKFSEPVGTGFGNISNISCLVFYDNTVVNLDNGKPELFPGEYKSGSPTILNCPNPGLDITAMKPVETAGFPFTGYSTKWQITYDDAAGSACAPGTVKGTSCTTPATTTPFYIKPSRSIQPFKRPDGTPVPDNDTNLSFQIPGP